MKFKIKDLMIIDDYGVAIETGSNGENEMVICPIRKREKEFGKQVMRMPEEKFILEIMRRLIVFYRPDLEFSIYQHEATEVAVIFNNEVENKTCDEEINKFYSDLITYMFKKRLNLL